MSNLSYKKFIFFFALMFFCFFVFLPFAHAGITDEISNTLKEFNVGAQLPKAGDPSAVIFNIINIILSFLGLFFFVMVLYGGFTYMTAGGSAEKTKKAIGIIKDAAIGVAIILVSGALVNYVIKTAIEAIK